MHVKRVKIKVQTLEEQVDEVEAIMRKVKAGTKVRPSRVVAFETIEVMRKFLTPQRQLLMRVIRRKKPGSVYELAALVKRDRKAVTEDLKVLEDLGLVAFRSTVHKGRARSQPHTDYDGARIDVSW